MDIYDLILFWLWAYYGYHMGLLTIQEMKKSHRLGMQDAIRGNLKSVQEIDDFIANDEKIKNDMKGLQKLKKTLLLFCIFLATFMPASFYIVGQVIK